MSIYFNLPNCIIGLCCFYTLTQTALANEEPAWLKGMKPCSVVKIYDGDTMTLRCPEKIKVRMHCIDTPEMQQTPWGKQARDHLRAKSPTNVYLDAKTQDKYGRTVGEVYTRQGISLNLYQVQTGVANVYARYCQDQRFFVAAETAKTQGMGIWAVSGLHQTPWVYRYKNR